MTPNQNALWEIAAWADTFRTALMMVRACRDDDTDAYWILYEGAPETGAPCWSNFWPCSLPSAGMMNGSRSGSRG